MSPWRFVPSPPANQAASIQTPLDTTQIAVIQMPSGALPSGGFITPRTRFINPASPLTANASALNITNQGGLQVFNRAEVGIFPCPPNDPIFNCPPGTGPGAASVPVTLTMRPATPWVLSLMDQSTLGIYTLGTGGLVPVPNSTVNANGTVSAPITQSALYFLAGAHHTRLDSSYASPVPYKPALGHTVITFRELAVDSIIKIYTIMGELVKEIHPAPGADEITWDVKNSDGETVASGPTRMFARDPIEPAFAPACEREISRIDGEHAAVHQHPVVEPFREGNSHSPHVSGPILKLAVTVDPGEGGLDGIS